MGPMTMPFGCHKGKRLSQIPPAYLTWLVKTVQDLDPRLRAAAVEELERRPPKPRGVPQPPASLADRLAWLLERIDDVPGCMTAADRQLPGVRAALEDAAASIEAALEMVRPPQVALPARPARQPQKRPPRTRASSPELRASDKHFQAIAAGVVAEQDGQILRLFQAPGKGA